MTARWCEPCRAYREPKHEHAPTLWDAPAALDEDLLRPEAQPLDAGTQRTIDVLEGTRLREQAIKQVADHAETEVRDALVAVVFAVARDRYEFTTDDVWARFRGGGGEQPHEPRLMGAVMRAAVKERWIEPSSAHVLSTRPECHRRPLRVWRSRVWAA